MALELSNESWRLAFGDGAKHRQLSVPAADLAALAGAVAKAKEHFRIIARFPQACTRADRRSVYAQQGTSIREGMRREWYNGIPAFYAEGAAGAARFSSGKGRHGDFSDI